MRNLSMSELVVSLLAMGVGALPAQDDDPTIDGKPLALWVKQLRNDNRGLQLRAQKALSAAPTELHARIVPAVVPVLRSERENDKFVAAQVLGEYGPVAKRSVPDLLPMLQGTQFERNRGAAAAALGRIFKEAPPSDEVDKVTAALIAVFDDKYSDVRREAVRACGVIGPAAKACIPHLAKRFGDRRLAAQPWEEQGERALVERAAVWTAGQMGPLAACHMDRLVALVGNDIGADICEAIGKIGATQDNMVPRLMTLVERGPYWENTAAKEKAFGALEAFGPKAAPAAPLLDRFLRERTFHGETGNPLRILRIMSNIGPAANAYQGTLEHYANLKAYEGVKPEELEKMRKTAQAAQEAAAGKAAPAARESP